MPDCRAEGTLILRASTLLLALCLAVGAWSQAIPGKGDPQRHGPDASSSPVVVLVSADAEWKVVAARFADVHPDSTPFGEWIIPQQASLHRVVLFHGGWGKIDAAASTQYAIDHWKPQLLVNIGTCGGFKGLVAKGDILLVDKTIVYDIVEQMGDSEEAIRHYSTTLDLSWVEGDLPRGVRRSLLLSGDRDIVRQEISGLRNRYGALAADWESGAIAHVARLNGVPVLILRGVSDLVGEGGGEAYGNEAAFESGARLIMNGLMDQLPYWLARWEGQKHH
jgi:adenosylhomocysteine nucleosidase